MSGAGARRLIDISPAIGVGVPVWPGDTAFDLEVGWTGEAGSPVTVSRLTLSPHTGAHADLPLHVACVWGGDPALPADAAGAPLEIFWGACTVFDLTGRAAIDRPDLAALDWDGVERALFRTQERRLDHFPVTFAHFTPAAAGFLAARGVAGGGALRLVGIDTFSVDDPASQDLPAHRALFGGGVAILESLDLAAVAAGRYELVALPLRLAGGDASPVRAVLRTLD